MIGPGGLDSHLHVVSAGNLQDLHRPLKSKRESLTRYWKRRVQQWGVISSEGSSVAMLYERDPLIPRIGSDCQQLRIEAKSISTLVATASSRYRPVRQARVMNVLQHPSITYCVLEEEEKENTHQLKIRCGPSYFFFSRSRLATKSTPTTTRLRLKE